MKYIIADCFSKQFFLNNNIFFLITEWMKKVNYCFTEEFQENNIFYFYRKKYNNGYNTSACLQNINIFYKCAHQNKQCLYR